MYESDTRQETAISGTVIPPSGQMIPADDRRVVGYTPHAGVLVPVYEARQQPVVYQPRDLTPQPLIDPRAQIMAAGGVLAAGTGWGIGQALAPIAGIGSGGLMWLAIAMVAWRLGPAMRRGDTHNHSTTNNNGFLSHSHTTNSSR